MFDVLQYKPFTSCMPHHLWCETVILPKLHGHKNSGWSLPWFVGKDRVSWKSLADTPTQVDVCKLGFASSCALKAAASSCMNDFTIAKSPSNVFNIDWASTFKTSMLEAWVWKPFIAPITLWFNFGVFCRTCVSDFSSEDFRKNAMLACPRSKPIRSIWKLFFVELSSSELSPRHKARISCILHLVLWCVFADQAYPSSQAVACCVAVFS